ncbi:MAG: pseudouridine synthase [Candidatus Krumholzibacteriia bacterium]
MRLNRFLAACGLGSRRRCDELIVSDRVRVNDVPGQLGLRVQPGDRVCVDGVEVHPQPPGALWMLHKPAGVVCTANDPQGRPTVLDLAERHGIAVRLFPIGRLDLDTTGLLLLTNDGELSFRLTHPSWGIDKEYEARVAEPLSDDEVLSIRDGIELEDGRTAACRATQELRDTTVIVRLVLHEGRKRQVRRMLAAVGCSVLGLHRVRIGPIGLGELPEGSMRPLDASEHQAILRALEAARGASGQAGRRPPS